MARGLRWTGLNGKRGRFDTSRVLSANGTFFLRYMRHPVPQAAKQNYRRKAAMQEPSARTGSRLAMTEKPRALAEVEVLAVSRNGLGTFEVSPE